ncbi:hypothetical protein ACWG8W_08150 [Citricoccus zhacaiensis]
MGVYGTSDEAPLWIGWTWIVSIVLLGVVGVAASFSVPQRFKPLWLIDWEESGADARYIAATIRVRQDYRRRRRRASRGGDRIASPGPESPGPRE